MYTTPKLPFWAAILTGAGLVLATLIFRLSLGFYLGDQPVLILYVIPILIGAYMGGLRAGLTTTLFAALAGNYFLLPPLHSFAITRPVNRIQWAALCFIGIALSLLMEKLHRACEMHSVTLASIGEAIVATDKSGRISFMNISALALMGCRHEDALGKPIEELFRIVDSQTRPIDSINQTLRNGLPASMVDELFLLTPGGKSVPISLAATRVKDNAGTTIGSVLVFHDITEKRKNRDSLTQLNQDLKRRLSELQTIFDTVPVGLAIADDPEGLNIRGNSANERLVGVSSGGQLSRRGPEAASYRAFQNGFEMEVERLPMQRAVRGETVIGEVIDIVREDETWVTLYCNATPLFDEEGKPRGAVGAFLDISEIKRAEEGLRKSEARFRRIFETNVVPIAYCHVDGRILDANDSFLRMLEYSRQELTDGKVRWDVATPQEWKQADEIALEQLLKSGGSRPTEKEYLRRDGTRVPVLIGASHFPENPDHVIAFAIDLTEQKKMEKRLCKARDELEMRIQERTAELRATMSRLQESNRALQDFASIASHDMQEPLRKVTSFGQLLQEKHGESFDEQGKDYLNRMIRATERMQSLITSLLDYSRVTSMAKPFQKVDLSALIQEVLSDLEARIASTGGTVNTGELPVIQADPTQMRQLFQNLISNALKFHKAEGKPIVTVHSSLKSDMECRIIVEDNGIGFSEEHLDQIFAPFQRLHGRSAYEGTGIGLAICRKIVDRHGGKITARSTPGKGTEFIVTLPVKQKTGI